VHCIAHSGSLIVFESFSHDCNLFLRFFQRLVDQNLVIGLVFGSTVKVVLLMLHLVGHIMLGLHAIVFHPATVLMARGRKHRRHVVAELACLRHGLLIERSARISHTRVLIDRATAR